MLLLSVLHSAVGLDEPEAFVRHAYVHIASLCIFRPFGNGVSREDVCDLGGLVARRIVAECGLPNRA